MLKFIIPALIVFLIVLFWERINEKIYEKFEIRINKIIFLFFLIILVTIFILLYF